MAARGVTSEDTRSSHASFSKSDVPVVLAVNKLDNPDREDEVLWEFYSLGLANPCRFRPRMAMARATCSMPSCASFPKMQVMTRRATR